jgi:pyruvate formate-lyase activating enzyme-like uncharacterized protein
MDKSLFVDQNCREYPDAFSAMNWITAEKAVEAENKRQELLQSLSQNARWRFSGTKVHTHEISPGCAICGEGDWSCLFVNGLCNARCFYCPSEQSARGVPVTNTLSFESPDDYRDYASIFNIRGISFSGGEPLLTFDRILKFLKKLKKQDNGIRHIWMYTNGILVTRDKLKALADAGIDEIRFDISAHHYLTDKAQMAVGIIPYVTVEIPAIPEDLPQLKAAVKTLYDSGVNFLNLHQLRCTPFNHAKMMERSYTFLHGPKVTVLESELAALELMRYTIDYHIKLPVNYCSFVFKNEFQAAGTRRRSAEMMKSGYEDATQKGYIRRMGIAGAPQDIEKNIRSLAEHNCDKTLWQVQKTGELLFFKASLWRYIDFTGCRLILSYFNTTLRSSVSYSHPFKEIRLNRHRKVVIEKKAETNSKIIEGDLIRMFADLYINGNHQIDEADNPFPDIDGYENFPQGLMAYY